MSRLQSPKAPVPNNEFQWCVSASLCLLGKQWLEQNEELPFSKVNEVMVKKEKTKTKNKKTEIHVSTL